MKVLTLPQLLNQGPFANVFEPRTVYCKYTLKPFIMKQEIRSLRPLITLLACFVMCPVSSYAFVEFVFSEVDNDVVLTASGSYVNLNDLGLGGRAGSAGRATKVSSVPTLTSTYSGSVSGTGNVLPVYGYSLSRIGGSDLFKSTSSGSNTADVQGVDGTGTVLASFSPSGGVDLQLPYDYGNSTIYSSATYSGSSVWRDKSLGDLGLAPGRYEIRWDSGNQGINYTVIPEPSTYAVLVSLGALGWIAFRRSRKSVK